MSLGAWTPQDIIALVGAISALIGVIMNARNKAGKSEVQKVQGIATAAIQKADGLQNQHNELIQKVEALDGPPEKST